MSDWLAPVRTSLDSTSSPVDIFFRNDDAGWADDRLYALLDLFTQYRIPIDLAIIPMALTDTLANCLLSYRHKNHQLIGLHQHGFNHVNHEINGRKCEFGAARIITDQWNNIKAGRERLDEKLGNALDPVFTPPWNRCNQNTIDCLQALGFTTLSRDKTATNLELKGLAEIPVHIDWCRIRQNKENSWNELGRILAEEFLTPGYTGIMLHHAVLNHGDHLGLADLLALLNEHKRTNCHLMRDLNPGY